MIDFESIVGSLSCPVLITEKNSNVVIFANDAFTKQYGYTAKDWQNAQPSWIDIIHPEDRPRVVALTTDAISDSLEIEYRIIAKDKKAYWVRNYIAGHNNSTAYNSHVITSIIKHKDTLAHLEQSLVELLNKNPTVIYRCEFSGCFPATFISNNIKEQLGYEPSMFLDTPSFWVDNIHPDDKHSVFEGLQVLFEKERYAHEYRFRHADGSYRWMHDELALTKDGEGNPKDIIGNWTDITAKKQLEKDKAILQQDILHAQKMRAIGTLAGGVAHEFNNMLGVIIGYGELLEQSLEKSENNRKYVEQILKASYRSTKLVKDLLSFSRKNYRTLELVDMCRQLEQEIQFFKSVITSSIQITLNTDETDCQVMIDQGELRQIIFSLVNNAVDALDKKGVIEFSVCKIIKNDRENRSLNVKNGSYVEVCVKDNGAGISSETLNRVFEPFFTTKVIGQGEGMGLSLVYNLMISYGGVALIDSQLDVGTTVHLYFPSLSNEDKLVNLENQIIKKSILLIDDEILFLEMGSNILTSLGYQVETATSSLRALDIFKANPDKYDMVITDQIMPELLGTELSKKLIEMRPDIPVILTTGYASNSRLDSMSGYGVLAVLVKPFSLHEIDAKLKEIFWP